MCVPARWTLPGFLLAVAAACGREDGATAPPEDPPGARRGIVEAMRADLRAARGPADGLGRAWRVAGESSPDPVQAGATGRWTFLYEAAGPGIAAGGRLVFQVSPFWGWSTPQVEDAAAAGFTRVTTAAGGVELEATTTDQQQLTIQVRGRALRPGERIRIEYGAGEGGARADRFAEAASRFWFRVDGDGDGVAGLVADAPAVRVVAGPAARAVLTLPSTATPGEPFRGVLALLDTAGNAGVQVPGGAVALEAPAGLTAPASLDLAEADDGVLSFAATPREEGVFFLHATLEGGLEAWSNPVAVQEGGARILWGDLQSHSSWSDGTGEPEDLYRYARDVAALDFFAVTDHDHWGMQPLDGDPEAWQRLLDTAAAFHEPGRFVTVPGYEWTNWIHGHRHVLFFDPAEAVLISSLDEATDTPSELWAALAGRRSVLTVAHHSAGNPVPADWSFPPDPAFEPVTEVVSVHGSSEAADSPRLIAGAMPGNFVRDVLGRGVRLGMIGSTDGHDGHPGLGHLASRCGGLAAVLAEENTREAILEALRARRCYATSGPRILLRVSLAGQRMGSVLQGPLPEARLVVFAAGVAPLSVVEVIRSGRVVETALGGGGRTLPMKTVLRDLRAGEFVYVRAVQEDRHFAVSSPFFVQ